MLGGQHGEINCKTTRLPLGRRVYLIGKRTLFFFWELVVWMIHIGRAGHQGRVGGNGGCLTNGDMALDSGAQFLAVAGHRLIPARARSSIGHQLRRELDCSQFGRLPVKIRFLVDMLVLVFSSCMARLRVLLLWLLLSLESFFWVLGL